jgi:hypothetical protein
VAYVSKHSDSELSLELERYKQQVLTLKKKLTQMQEVSLISAKIIDSRILFREGRQLVEYKLQVDTNSRGTLYVWHRYSTFQNLAATLSQKSNSRGRYKDIPDLPRKQFFGSVSAKNIEERIQKLNEFLDAAASTDYLQWGIRVDQDTCVFKRRRQSLSDMSNVFGPDDDSLNTDLMRSSNASSIHIASKQRDSSLLSARKYPLARSITQS